jgi:protein-tyrosine phosphatase
VGAIVVRRAVASDAPDVRRVIELAIRGSSPTLYSRTQIEAWATGGSVEGVLTMIERTVGFVAESNGVVVGFSNLDGGEVDQLYVDPDVDGTGVARTLYRAVEAEAIERGVTVLTATASLRALPAFRAFGFEELARVDRPFNGATFEVVQMRKQLTSVRRIALGGVKNFRDLGGYPTRDGRHTRWRQVLRSDGLHKLEDGELAAFAALDVGTVIDLRRDDEREEQPHRFPCVCIPLPSRKATATPGVTLEERRDGERWLFDEYCTMLELGGPLFGELFTLVAEAPAPVVIHCMGGKDRTGLTVALLLDYLGVERAVVLDDYELTSKYLGVEHIPDVVAMFVDNGIARPAAEGMLSAPRWAMNDALAILDDQFGGIERYLRTSGAMDDETLHLLRTRLVS